MINEINNTSPEFNNGKFEPWIKYYSRSFGIDIIFDNNLKHPAWINTSNLKEPKIYLNMKMIKKEMNFSDNEIFFILFHELEHLKEDIELRKTKDWQEIYERRNKKSEEKWLSYDTMENLLRDIYVNKQVIHPKNVPVLIDTLKDIYKNNLFKENNFLNFPRHLQFIYTIFREEMIKNEKCIIEDDIRNIITRLKRNNSLEQSTNWSLWDRLENMWERIEPTYEKLLNEDRKKQQEEQKKQQQNWKENKDWEENKDSQNWETENQEENKQNQEKQDWESWKSEDWEKNNQEWDNNQEWETWENNNQEWDNQSWEQKDSFDDLYKKYDGLPHIIEDNIDQEEFKEKLEEIIQEQIKNEKPKTREELELEQRVKSILSWEYSDKKFEELKRKLQNYEEYYKQLKKIKDPETGKFIIDEISELFKQIKSKRQKPRFVSKWPVDIEIWVRLDPLSIAEWIAQIKSWNLDPEMFEEDITIEREKEFVWKFDVTIISDWSGSMKWEKNTEQKKAVLLIFEALKKINDKLHYEKKNMLNTLEITTRWIIFKWWSDIEELKEESKLFSDKDRLQLFEWLNYYYWWTTNDYDSLEKVYDDFLQKDSKYKKSIKTWKIKNIVFVMTDWKSSSKNELKENISRLRKEWVIVYWIWITNWWWAVLENYKWDNKELWFWQVCEKAENLAKTLKNILKDHLEKI